MSKKSNPPVFSVWRSLFAPGAAKSFKALLATTCFVSSGYVVKMLDPTAPASMTGGLVTDRVLSWLTLGCVALGVVLAVYCLSTFWMSIRLAREE